MNNKIKSVIMAVVFAVFTLSVSVICILSPVKTHSLSERRELAQFPKTSKEAIFSGEFSSEFESYTTDQFPARDALRTIKSFVAYNVFNKLDNNGLFYADGRISKIDSAENETMMNHAAERFTHIYNKYLKGKDVYFSIVPDKNFVLAKENGYPSLDYEGFAKRMSQKVNFMNYIDIYDLLESDDYYKTDTHWRQENIIDIKDRLLSAMGEDINGGSYKENVLDKAFYGVYAGQLAKKVKPDTIKYLTNDAIDNAVVSYIDGMSPQAVVGDMYNMEKANGHDPYEMFLSGTMPIVFLENPESDSEKELILFRDSFGSSIAPLFLSGYKKVTLIDVRYIKSDYLGHFVDFNVDADVLFLYSSTLLNNSLAIQ